MTLNEYKNYLFIPVPMFPGMPPAGHAGDGADSGVPPATHQGRPRLPHQGADQGTGGSKLQSGEH